MVPQEWGWNGDGTGREIGLAVELGAWEKPVDGVQLLLFRGHRWRAENLMRQVDDARCRVG